MNSNLETISTKKKHLICFHLNANLKTFKLTKKAAGEMLKTNPLYITMIGNPKIWHCCPAHPWHRLNEWYLSNLSVTEFWEINKDTLQDSKIVYCANPAKTSMVKAPTKEPKERVKKQKQVNNIITTKDLQDIDKAKEEQKILNSETLITPEKEKYIPIGSLSEEDQKVITSMLINIILGVIKEVCKKTPWYKRIFRKFCSVLFVICLMVIVSSCYKPICPAYTHQGQWVISHNLKK